MPFHPEAPQPNLSQSLPAVVTQKDCLSTDRACAVCRSPLGSLLYRQRFSAISGGQLLDGYDVVYCKVCGFCFASPLPDQSAFDQYYREMSKYEHFERGGQVSEYDLARFCDVAGVIEEFLPSPETRILEIGCANGKLLSLLKENGYANVAGVDPSPGCAEIARRLYGVPVTVSTLSDVSLPDGSVDFLIMIGVLEHVRDLESALKTLSKSLAIDGRFFISVPDASRYTRGSDAPFQEFSVEHINFFGPLSLANLMARHGFKEVAYRQTLIDPSYKTSTPVLHAVYRKTSSFRPVVKDEETSAELAAYVSQSEEVDQRVHRAMERRHHGDLR